MQEELALLKNEMKRSPRRGTNKAKRMLESRIGGTEGPNRRASMIWEEQLMEAEEFKRRKRTWN